MAPWAFRRTTSHDEPGQPAAGSNHGTALPVSTEGIPPSGRQSDANAMMSGGPQHGVTGHFHSFSVPAAGIPSYPPYYGPPVAYSPYVAPSPVWAGHGSAAMDPVQYEQWQLNYALAMSMNEHAARQGPPHQPGPGPVARTSGGSRDVSTKGQAEALSYKYWATGRCVPCHASHVVPSL